VRKQCFTLYDPNIWPPNMNVCSGKFGNVELPRWLNTFSQKFNSIQEEGRKVHTPNSLDM